MDPMERLALRAALLPPAEARQAWAELTEAVAWMAFPDDVQRCLPAIAVNLGCHGSGAQGLGEHGSAVAHAGRLSGVYRASWAENILRIRQMRPLLEDLARSSVDYRVLKGAAICAMTDRWGVRRMGDVDIVVASAHAHRTMAALRDHGFQPRFFRRINPARPPDSACWEGPEGQILDLHVASRRRARGSILDWAVRAPAIPLESQGIRWPVPPPEVMLIHALKHAQLGAAHSDHAQALLDAHLLLPRVDSTRVMALAHRTRSLGLLQALYADLAAIGRDAPGGRGYVPDSSDEWRQAWRRSWRGEVRRALRLPGVLVERLPTRHDLQEALAQQHVRRTFYVPWLVLGQLRPLERAAVTLAGGFVRKPGGSITIDREIRVRVGAPAHIVGKSASLSITCSDPCARVLFVNGESAGVLAGQGAVLVRQVPEMVEVSARFLGDPPEGSGTEHTLSVRFSSLDNRALGISPDSAARRK